MTKTLLLILILLLAGFMAFIPHIGYAYPLHVDEWMHLTYAKTIAQTGAISFPDPFTGEGTVGPGSNVWLGYHILMAIVQRVSGVDWLALWRFGPSVIFMLTVLCVYLFANKQGYGLEAAFFTCLIPTTVGLLGPAFMAPMALGLLFIPLSLYIAFYVKSWPAYLLLFLIACFLWSMHPTTAAIQGIMLLPFILITLSGSRVRGLGLLAALLLPVLIALPLTINQLLPAAGQLLSPKEVFPPPWLDLPAVLQIYGFIPLIFCFGGIIYLLKRGNRYNYALLVALVLLLVIMLAFARFQVGMDSIFVRGVSSALLLIGIIAGAGLYWLRTQLLSARLLDKCKPAIAAYSGSLLCALSVVVITALAIPGRFNIPYYHMIDDEDYRAFVWIRDNIGPEYEKALVDPWKATAFVALTGKKVARRIWVEEEPIDSIIYAFLGDGCRNSNILRSNQIAIVYNRVTCDNSNLININKYIYMVNPLIIDTVAEDNMIKNGDFERLAGKPPIYWGNWSTYCKAQFLFPEPDRKDGFCIAIHISDSDSSKQWPKAVWTQKVPVIAGKSYIISGWLRTINISGKKGANIIMDWWGPDSNWIADSSFMGYVKGTNDWTFYSGKVVAPPGASTCTISCLMADCSGITWYDGIIFKAE